MRLGEVLSEDQVRTLRHQADTKPIHPPRVPASIAFDNGILIALADDGSLWGGQINISGYGQPLKWFRLPALPAKE